MTSSKLRIGDGTPDFELPGIDGEKYSLNAYRGRKVVVVVFSCNHCPYVKANEDRLIQVQRDYGGEGVILLAVNSNDSEAFPEDSFENMVLRAKEKGFNFPYLRDETQRVARAYGASVTPEVFVLDRELRLRYHGRIDDSVRDPSKVVRHDLRRALDAVLKDEAIDTPETQAFGCTIKWRTPT